MIEIDVRRLLVYGATGVFFLMAAMGQLQGASLADTFLKAGAGCLVVLLLGLPVVRIVDNAVARGKAAEAAPQNAVVTPASPTPDGGEGAAGAAEEASKSA